MTSVLSGLGVFALLPFFGLGPTELLIILGLILLIFGPKKIPEIGKSIGKAIKEFRNANDDDSKKEK